jgi:hypothetical protein
MSWRMCLPGWGKTEGGVRSYLLKRCLKISLALKKD